MKKNQKKQKQIVKDNCDSRVYSLPFFGMTIARNLVPYFFKKIYFLEMVKNDICLGGVSKQMPFLSKNILKKHTHAPSMACRIGRGQILRFFIDLFSNLCISVRLAFDFSEFSFT